jgi:hypothetical protein
LAREFGFEPPTNRPTFEHYAACHAVLRGPSPSHAAGRFRPHTPTAALVLRLSPATSAMEGIMENRLAQLKLCAIKFVHPVPDLRKDWGIQA